MWALVESINACVSQILEIVLELSAVKSVDHATCHDRCRRSWHVSLYADVSNVTLCSLLRLCTWTEFITTCQDVTTIKLNQTNRSQPIANWYVHLYSSHPGVQMLVVDPHKYSAKGNCVRPCWWPHFPYIEQWWVNSAENIASGGELNWVTRNPISSSHSSLNANGWISGKCCHSLIEFIVSTSIY